MNHAELVVQGVVIAAPITVLGLTAWVHLARQVSRVDEKVQNQNGRLARLETGVVYKDTCEALHDQTAQMVARMNSDMVGVDAKLAELLKAANGANSLRPGLPFQQPPGGST